MPTMTALARDLVAREGVLVIAHRGASADAPENTLPAFRRALEAGADLVELDYRHDREGAPHVLHDETLDRTTDALRHWQGEQHAIAARTAKEIAALDAGSWFDPRFRGTRVPRLDEALRVVRDGGAALIERKAGDASTLVDLLVRMDLVERVVVQAFDWDFLAACRRARGDLLLAALGSKELGPERLERLRASGARIVAWDHRHVDEVLARAVHESGLRLWAFTVNEAQRARELRALGVRGIITDRPAAIRAALAADAAGRR